MLKEKNTYMLAISANDRTTLNMPNMTAKKSHITPEMYWSAWLRDSSRDENIPPEPPFVNAAKLVLFHVRITILSRRLFEPTQGHIPKSLYMIKH
jgi:hypothetical protein